MEDVVKRSFAAKVIRWQRRHGRRALPWQQEKSPYHTWVSEILLQQTQVAKVVPHFQRLIARFPNPSELAKASLDDVLGLWSGLGYYARAQNLHLAAQKMVAQHQGDCPSRFEDWLAMPGVGRSTAGAVLSLAFREPFPILDGNVKRILQRHFFVPTEASQPPKQLWQLATALVPRQRPDVYNQGLMDLGALVCRPKNPRCERCPLANSCLTRQSGGWRHKAVETGLTKPRRNKPVRMWWPVLIRCDDQVWLEPVPRCFGIWKGLHAFPGFSTEAALQAWYLEFSQELRVLAPLERLPSRVHACSHLSLSVFPSQLRLDWPLEPKGLAQGRWYASGHWRKVGHPALVRQLLS